MTNVSKSKVNTMKTLNYYFFHQLSFFKTGATGRRRRSLRAASFDDYKDLALASGGQAIRVSKSELPQATDIIRDTSTSALVRILQAQAVNGLDLLERVRDKLLLLLLCFIFR